MLPKKILIFLSSIIICFSSITKSYSIEADIFIQSTVNRAAETLGGNLTKDQRIEKLKEIAIDTVDIDGIGFYSLGSYKKTINDSQMKEYKFLFQVLLEFIQLNQTFLFNQQLIEQLKHLVEI